MRSIRLPADFLIASALALLGMALRIPLLGRGFWRDEGATYFDISVRTFGEVLAATRAHEITPPAYFVLAWIWGHFFGTTEVALHMFSLLWCLIAIVCAYALGNTIGGRYAGIAVGLCAAMAPLWLDIGMEARPYGMILALATFTLLAFFRARQGANGAWTAAFALGALVLGATHYTAIAFVGLLALASLTVALVQRTNDKRADSSRSASGPWMVIAVAFVAALLNGMWAFGAMQDRSRIHPWVSGAGGVRTSLDDGLNYFAPFGTMNAQVVYLFEILFLVWLIATVRRWYRYMRVTMPDERTEVDSAIAICSAIAIGGVLFSYLTHTPEERHLAVFVPAAWCAGVLLAQYTIAQLRAPYTWILPWRVIAVLLTAYIGLGGVVHYPHVYSTLLAPISGARAAVATAMQDDVRTIVAAPPVLEYSLGYYLDRSDGPQLVGISERSDRKNFVPDNAPSATVPGADALAQHIGSSGLARIVLFYDPSDASPPLLRAAQQLYTGLLHTYRVTAREDFFGRRESVEFLLLTRRRARYAPLLRGSSETQHIGALR